jgi:acetyl-CoA C-acetyltransferase
MADALVADPGSVGMVTAVGMHLSKHAAAVLSTHPGSDAGPGAPPAASVAANPVRRPIVDTFDGPAQATIAAYTVHHAGDGTPTEALMVCDVSGTGQRCYARATDPGRLDAMEREELVGRQVTLRSDGAVNQPG